MASLSALMWLLAERRWTSLCRRQKRADAIYVRASRERARPAKVQVAWKNSERTRACSSYFLLFSLLLLSSLLPVRLYQMQIARDYQAGKSVISEPLSRERQLFFYSKLIPQTRQRDVRAVARFLPLSAGVIPPAIVKCFFERYAELLAQIVFAWLFRECRRR